MQPRGAALDGLTVLVLDDHSDSREVLSLSLRQCGAIVETADSVADATERIRERRPDVLVSDLAMPGEDGFSLLKKVRALDRGADIPVIAVTGFASEADRVRTLAAGFAAHFSKPVDLDRLVATVGVLVDGSNRVADIRA
jgi:CheY-like chemotaxis protein